MFGMCCCAESNENHQLTTSSADCVLAEQVTSGNLVHQETLIGRGPQDLFCPRDRGPQEASPTQFLDSDPYRDPASARSLSPEEKDAEKARLQQLVNTFAKKAVR